MTTVLEYLRLVNAGLALVAVVLVVNMATSHWDVYTPRSKWVTIAFCTLLIGAVAGSLDQFFSGAEGSWRSVPVTLACAFVVIARFSSEEMFEGEGQARHRRSKKKRAPWER